MIMERVLHFTPGFRLGGIENLLLGLYQHIDRDRFQFDFVTDNTEQMHEFDEIRSMGGRVHQFGRYLDDPIKYQKKFGDIIRNLDPQTTVFHSHDALRSWPLLVACKRRGIKRRILHSHTDSFEGSKRKYVAKPILSLTNRLASQFLACSSEAGRFMFPGRNFFLFNNAIDLNKFAFNPLARASLRKKMGIGAQTIVIGHTGRFTFQKNHKWMLAVFSEFIKVHPDSKMLLVGSGPLENDMRSLAAQYGLSRNVIFAGKQSKINDYLSTMDLFIMPSHFEGLALALIESQANGLPALVSDNITDEASLTEAITQFSLDAVPNEWAKELASLHFKGRFNSRDQIRKLRACGYDISAQANKLMDFYESPNSKELGFFQ